MQILWVLTFAKADETNPMKFSLLQFRYNPCRFDEISSTSDSISKALRMSNCPTFLGICCFRRALISLGRIVCKWLDCLATVPNTCSKTRSRSWWRFGIVNFPEIRVKKLQYFTVKKGLNIWNHLTKNETVIWYCKIL